MSAVSPGAPLRVALLTAATTGTSQPVDVSAYTHLTFYCKTNGSPGAGVITFEEADYAPGAPTGLTWSAIDTLTVTSGIGNSAQTAYHVGGPGGAFSYAYVRARISTTVTSTTVDVVLRAS